MNDTQAIEQTKLTVPNLLTGFRFVAAPGLLWLAWHGYGLLFMGLLAVSFLSDLLDGFVARLMGQMSQFGATLDSWADVVIYLTIPLGCWWLWPRTVSQEWFYVALFLASCLLPALVGFCKFGCFTSYHTWAVKFAAASMGVSLCLLFLGGMAWPFRIASVIGILAALEEVAITLFLSGPESNVRSIWFLLSRSKH
ncbi:MAG: CDP-alcohol phosphatidyltransferase family protein [Methylococcales bacterium]